MNNLQYVGRLRSVLALCILAGCTPPPSQPIGATTAPTANITSPMAWNMPSPVGTEPVWQGKPLTAWVRQLNSDQATERTLAADALRRIGKPAAKPVAQLLLQRPSSDAQDLSDTSPTMAILLLLAEIGPDEATAEFLIPRLNTRNTRKRAVVAAALAALGGEKAMGALLIDTSARMAHGDMKDPAIAAGDRLVISILELRHAQANRGPTDIVTAWKAKYEGKQTNLDDGGPYDFLGYKSIDDYLCVMRILKEIGRPSVEPLVPLLRHNNEKLRRAALATLCLIADDIEEPDYVYPHIISALESHDEVLRGFASSALKSQTGEDYGGDPSKWRQWLQRRRGTSSVDFSGLSTPVQITTDTATQVVGRFYDAVLRGDIKEAKKYLGEGNDNSPFIPGTDFATYCRVVTLDNKTKSAIMSETDWEGLNSLYMGEVNVILLCLSERENGLAGLAAPGLSTVVPGSNYGRPGHCFEIHFGERIFLESFGKQVMRKLDMYGRTFYILPFSVKKEAGSWKIVVDEFSAVDKPEQYRPVEIRFGE
ncbi:MAG: armadillo/beta-catenin-like repeat-containing protein [Planctomycetota bacterium]